MKIFLFGTIMFPIFLFIWISLYGEILIEVLRFKHFNTVYEKFMSIVMWVYCLYAISWIPLAITYLK